MKRIIMGLTVAGMLASALPAVAFAQRPPVCIPPANPISLVACQ